MQGTTDQPLTIDDFPPDEVWDDGPPDDGAHLAVVDAAPSDAAEGFPASCSRDTAAAAAGRSGEACDLVPPVVIRGANKGQVVSDDVVVSVGIDWIRMSGPESVLPAARRLISETFGVGGQLKPCSGRFFYLHGERAACGVLLLFDPEVCEGAKHCTIDIPGSALQLMGGGRRVQLLGDLFSIGFCNVSRLDLFNDYVGQVYLVEAVFEACQAFQLCGARRWEPIRPMSSRGRVLGFTVNLGRRGGDGSGRFVRVYDKGLEQQQGANEWHRFEVELSGGVARQGAEILVRAWQAGGDAWRTELSRIVLGAVDFREVRNGETALKRRPQVAWWSLLVAGVGRRCLRAARAVGRDLRRTARHIVKSCAVLSQCAAVVGMTFGEVYAECEKIDGKPARWGPQGQRVAEQFKRWVQGRLSVTEGESRGDRRVRILEAWRARQQRMADAAWLEGQRQAVLAGVPF